MCNWIGREGVLANSAFGSLFGLQLEFHRVPCQKLWPALFTRSSSATNINHCKQIRGYCLDETLRDLLTWICLLRDSFVCWHSDSGSMPAPVQLRFCRNLEAVALSGRPLATKISKQSQIWNRILEAQLPSHRSWSFNFGNMGPT